MSETRINVGKINIIWKGNQGGAVEDRTMAPPYDYRGFAENQHSRENGFQPPPGLPGLLKSHKRPLLWPCIGFLMGATYPIPIRFPKCLTVVRWIALLCIFAAVTVNVLRRLLKAGAAGSRRIGRVPAVYKMSAAGSAGGCASGSAAGVILLVAVGFMLGAMRADAWQRKILSAEYLANAAWSRTLGGVQSENPLVIVEVMSNPKTGERRTEFSGKIHRLIDATSGETSSLMLSDWKGLLVNVSIFQGQSSASIRRRDILVVSGKFSVPQSAKNPGEFDYRRYLMSKGIFAELKGTVKGRVHGNSQVIQPGLDKGPTGGLDKPGQAVRLDGLGQPWHMSRPPWPDVCREFFQRISLYIETRIDEALVGEEQGILKALFLGDRGEISSQDSAGFRLSGLYRFIAITGFHVEMASRAVERLSRKITKNVNASRILGVLAAWFWAGLSGWSTGPLRAFLCVVLRHFAFWTRWKHETLAACAVCGIVIGFRIPYPLLDTSFQLSFAGMVSAWVTREYVSVFGSRLRLGMVRRSLLQSLFMAALLLPLLACHFQDVSIAGFFLGGLWAVLAVAGMLSFVPVLCFPWFAGKALGWLSFFVLHGMRYLSNSVARLPAVSFAFPAPGLIETLSYYGIVLLLLEAVRQGPGRRPAKRLALPALSLILFLSVFMRYYISSPQVVFLSVGQGDCVIVRTGLTLIIVDTGTYDAASRVLAPYLKRQGIRRIDLCIVSHLHSDHAGGLEVLCSGFDVKEIMTCPGSKEAVAEMIAASAHTKITEAGAGEVYRIGNAIIEVVHPAKGAGTGAGTGAGIHTGAGRGMGVGTGAVTGTGAGGKSTGSQGEAGTALAGIATSSGQGGDGYSNEDSLVFTLQAQGFPAYLEFWGDAPGKVVMDLIEAPETGQGIGQADQEKWSKWPAEAFQGLSRAVVPIVKVPHHGSPDSLVFGFYGRLSNGLGAISGSGAGSGPEAGSGIGASSGAAQPAGSSGVAIISVGPNSYGHPSQDVIESAEKNGFQVLRTDLDGAVMVRIYRTRIRVKPFLRW